MLPNYYGDFIADHHFIEKGYMKIKSKLKLMCRKKQWVGEWKISFMFIHL